RSTLFPYTTLFRSAEITDQDGVAEGAEVARRPHHAPRRVHPRPVLQVTDMLAVGSKDLDEAEALTADGIVPQGILLGVSHEQAAANVLDIEGSKSARHACGVAVVTVVTVAVVIVGIEGILAEVNGLEVGV